ncbi:MAG: hypothetical protein F4160_17585 [Rhodospirillaceae bacterium]|nr:hypothetical protein [Rhodospirillaceae bacterium]MYF08127.1 hypothetical protein [Rhodospirillaceae bacterium]MYH38605.1 hypothetical protein [Rhodospirillaceae bacterium]MYK13108.1 hypothetical protein [Rhodospirillaceae bacterium]
MARNDRTTARTSTENGDGRADARRSHSIRFADSEWQLIERAAARQGIPAGEFARSGALAAAENRMAEPPLAVLSPGHLALVETMWRMVYVLATLNREQLLDAGREDDLDELVSEARDVMQETMAEGPA